MKRFTVAGIFAMIGGAATLLLVASILYSCRQGGHPHEMGKTPDANEERPAHSSVAEDGAERAVALPPSAQEVTFVRA